MKDTAVYHVNPDTVSNGDFQWYVGIHLLCCRECYSEMLDTPERLRRGFP